MVVLRDSTKSKSIAIHILVLCNKKCGTMCSRNAVDNIIYTVCFILFFICA